MRFDLRLAEQVEANDGKSRGRLSPKVRGAVHHQSLSLGKPAPRRETRCGSGRIRGVTDAPKLALTVPCSGAMLNRD